MLEGGDHAAHRLMKQHLDDPLQEARLELEIDKEVDAAAARRLFENPVIVEIAERPLGVFDIDAARRVERNARGEALAEHAEANDQIGDDQVRAALAYAGTDAPRQEFRIALNIGDEREELLRRIGEHPLLGMSRHRG